MTHLKVTYDRAPKHDIVMILGDLKAKIDKKKAYESVTGKNTPHEVSNQNGEIVGNFLNENSMTVMTTQFQHKIIHKGTWISPDLTTVNQTDYINTNKEKTFFDALLTVHLSIFISVINQPDAKNFCFTIVYFMPLHISSTCAHHQGVKIVLHSLWYHHTYRWPSRAQPMHQVG